MHEWADAGTNYNMSRSEFESRCPNRLMLTKMVPGTDETEPGSESPKSGSVFHARDGFLAPLGDPGKSNWAPKASQQIQYGDLWASRSGPKAPKSLFWRGLNNTLIFECFLLFCFNRMFKICYCFVFMGFHVF